MSLNRFSLILFLLSFSLVTSLFPVRPSLTLIIDPAGNTQETGRPIDTTFERTITLYMAQELKEAIEYLYDNVTVILTRTTGKKTDALHNATFANRLGTDLYISLNAFKTKESIPQFYFYYVSYNQTKEKLITTNNLPFFTPICQAYTCFLPLSRSCCTLLYDQLVHATTQQYTLLKPLGIPFIPLYGIACPSFAIECGLPTEQSWRTLVNEIAHNLLPVFKKLAYEKSKKEKHYGE